MVKLSQFLLLGLELMQNLIGKIKSKHQKPKQDEILCKPICELIPSAIKYKTYIGSKGQSKIQQVNLYFTEELVAYL